LWWVKDSPLPFPLVTTGPGDSDNPGALGHGGVPFLTGPSVDYGITSGVRATVGTWLDYNNRLGIEASGFVLPKQSKSFRASSDANGNPVLAFRYLDPPDVNGVEAEDAFQAAIPPGSPFGLGPFAGSVGVTTSTRLWGAEVNVAASLADTDSVRLQVLGGVRFAQLDESLSLDFQRGAINDAMVVFQGNPFPAPTIVSSSDSFRVRNQFYGGQLGLRGEYQFGKVFVGASGKVALGSSHERVEIAGSSTLIAPGVPPMTVAGGQFAGFSNSGRTINNEFAVMPEAEIQVGYQLTRAIRGYVGYDFFYWSRVARPGNQVDLVVDTRANQVDPGFVPGTAVTFPQPRSVHSEFWAQGLTFGLEVRY
jgi:hypothetical protein